MTLVEAFVLIRFFKFYVIFENLISISIDAFHRPYQDNSLIFEVRLGDVMDLICPFYDEQQQQNYLSNELEQYDIYYVCVR